MKLKKVNIHKWTSKDPEGEDIEESTLTLMTALLSIVKPEDKNIKGFDKLRMYNRIANALETAKDSDAILLETGDYNYLEDVIKKDVPVKWGLRNEIADALADFMDAETVDVEEKKPLPGSPELEPESKKLEAAK